jgi:hypothetical protein
VGCAHPLRSFRLPFGSPNPIPLWREGSHPIEYFYNWLAIRSLGVVWRRGWDSNPRSAVMRTADFESAPLQPLRYLSIFVTSSKILAFIFSLLLPCLFEAQGGMCSVASLLSASPLNFRGVAGRIPLQAGRLKPTRQPLLILITKFMVRSY